MNDSLQQLALGKLPLVLVGENEVLPVAPLLFSGSFNPLHEGHLGLLRAAEVVARRKGFFELSLVNVDKPPLSTEEVERRLRHLQAVAPVVLTRAPTFIEKAELFPGAWFALGFDTAIRLLSRSYHTDLLGMLTRFQTLEIRFVVAGRRHENRFQTLEELRIPSGFESLFIPIPERAFRVDISSTELRCSG